MRILHLTAALSLSLASLTVAPQASAEPVVTSGKLGLQASQPLGRTNVKWLMFDIYTAELWTDRRQPFAWNRPFALSLTYKRDFDADDLARASVEEIARIEGSAPAGLESRLRSCFADVNPGDRITGVATGSDKALFFVNGRQSCAVSYPQFTKRFFGIWLGPNTRDPGATRRLLGS
ncbi:chalcone isomerase family protein [Oceanomicrobium pacificus]|uniref:Chalcone isomerase domain-containing protein n=1 Tax=Oceanomicrobium pacificus TaxID=2692916 RepID=A0A6B0TW91_9RHOB|nr:chalcone isomerase family protein [Oceanomicrobium pacificus]MXU66005.1 hypothetical protein [Oceanomicrobium pacificus]